MELTVSPWFWGLCGAFIYAGPRWIISLSTARDAKASATPCTQEFVMALVVGSITAGTFGSLLGSVALTTLHLKDDNAVCGVIGLFANRIAPELVDKGSGALSASANVFTRVLKALKGDEK